jgi:hypothetical protein
MSDSKHPTIEITVKGLQGAGKSTIAAAIREMLAAADIGAAVAGNEEPAPDGKAIKQLSGLRDRPRVIIMTRLSDLSDDDRQQRLAERLARAPIFLASDDRRDMKIAAAIKSILERGSHMEEDQAICLTKEILAAIDRTS